MTTKTKSYDKEGRFVDVIERGDDGEAISGSRHEIYSNPFDVLNDDVGKKLGDLDVGSDD